MTLWLRVATSWSRVATSWSRVATSWLRVATSWSRVATSWLRVATSSTAVNCDIITENSKSKGFYDSVSCFNKDLILSNISKS
ncbi:hypothetical protein HanIR_Chr02g0052941 [Helianthus annuus]|nr:hypothetical protein HanIR_Chr02g0052941 [Helianthus annuus]